MNEKANAAVEFQDYILGVMKVYNRPVAINEISQEIDVPYYITEQGINELKRKEKVTELVAGKGKEKYYVLTNENNSLDEELSQKYVDMASAFEKQYQEIKDENESLKNKIDKIYANIISLMGVFVAIFALIIINVDAIGMFAINAKNVENLFFSLLIFNIPLVIAIVVLMLLIKFIIFSKK